MFHSLSASKVSLSCLRCAFYYANFLGVICFGIRRNRDGDLVAFNNSWIKWYSLICRVFWIIYFCYYYSRYILIFDDFYSKMMHITRWLGLVICNVSILVMQIFYGQSLLKVTNRFLKLFGRIRILTRRQNACYGSDRELALLLVNIAFLGHELLSQYLTVFTDSEIKLMWAFSVSFVALSSSMIMHICFVGYLSVGVLYDEINKFVHLELRSRLRLQEELRNRQRLKKANLCLDEFVAIYNEIQDVANRFSQLFDVTFSLVLMFYGLTIVVRSYDIITRLKFSQFVKITIVAKNLADVILMVLTIQGAVNGAERIRQLSLDNFNVIESRTWDEKMEIFLSRLTLCEFHVRPLDLFEMNNEFILFILSSLLTYLTYLIAL